jgi:hypothetical protein
MKTLFKAGFFLSQLDREKMTVAAFESIEGGWLGGGKAFMGIGIDRTINTAHCAHQVLVTLADKQHLGTSLTCSPDLATYATSAQASRPGKCRIPSCLFSSSLEIRRSLW